MRTSHAALRRERVPAIRRQVTTAAAVQLLARTVAWILTLFAAGLLARHLGPVRFGDYSLALLLGSVVSVVADAGLSAISLREASRHGDDDAFVAGLVWFKTGVQTGIFALLAPFLLLVPHRGLPVAALFVGASVSVLSLVAGSFQLPAQRRIRFSATGWGDAFGRLLQLIAVVAAVHARADVTWLLATALLVPGGALFIAVLSARNNLSTWRGRLPKGQRARLFTTGLPLGLVLVVGLLHFKVDSLLISWLRPAAELGLYSVDYRIIELVLAVPQLLLLVAFPVMARMDGRSLTSWAGTVFAWLWIGALPVLAAIFVFARFCVVLVAGSSFAPAATALRILVLATFFAWLNTIFAQLSTVANLQRRVLAVSLLGLSANIAGNLLVVPRWGYVGAAWMTVGSEAIGFALVYRVVTNVVPVDVPFVRLLAATGMCVAAVSSAVFLPHIWLQVLGLLVWSALAAALGRRTLRDLWKRLSWTSSTLLDPPSA